VATDENRVAFLRGVLAALASTGQVVHYKEIRRLCRFSQEQLGTYLGEARKPLSSGRATGFLLDRRKGRGLAGRWFRPASRRAD
jgi:hypothetical protein